MKYSDLFAKPKQHLTLGDVLTKLQNVRDKSKYVYFANLVTDDDYANYEKKPVNSFFSWRGSYYEPSCGTDGSHKHEVGSLIDLLKNFIGSTQTGYKGGEFIMHKGSELWADPYGCYYSYGVIDVVECDEGVFFVVDKCES